MIELRTAHDLFEAVRLAEGAFAATREQLGDYRLVGAEHLLAGGESCSGVACWRLTFKRASLIPSAASARIGAGGELFFVVDLDTATANFTGTGE
jgi:hypothetical protein